MIKLSPLAMRVPNSQGIYAMSKLQQPKTISLDKFEDYKAQQIKVSFELDGISNPQTMSAYGYGFDCWYLAEIA